MPKRSLVALAALAVLAALPPARALPPSESGTVRLAAATPIVQRLLFNQTGDNGTVGYVIEIPKSADGKEYVLRKTSGATGRENLDVYFYADLSGSQGNQCNDGTTSSKVPWEPEDQEAGVMCPESERTVAWAIVVLSAGANAGFTLSW